MTISIIRRTLVAVFAILGCALVCLHAQSTFGSIVGAVRDASGAPMPGAAIKIRNRNDNTTRSTLSDPSGEYEILNLRPGSYEITGSKTDFLDATIPSVTLDARQQLRADLKLELAGVKESVTVEGESAAVNTENAVIGDTKNFNQVVQLPMNYRGGSDSPLAALVAVAGVQQDRSGNMSIGGGTSAQIQFSVDGTSTVNVRQNGALANMNPSSELISEMKVTQFNNNAEFSQLADVTIITKSGTNTLHGSAFEYMQNSALDATTYGFDSKAHKAYNTFGGSFSGPVQIPASIKARIRRSSLAITKATGAASPRRKCCPCPRAPCGRETLRICRAAPRRIRPRAPLPGNHIPGAQMNSVAQSLLDNYVPLPDFGDGAGTNGNYRLQTPTPARIDGYDVRVDHNINARQQLYGRWSWKNVDSTAVNGLLPSERDHETNRNLILSHNYAIRPTLLNEIRFGLTYYARTVNFPSAGPARCSHSGCRV